MPLFRLFSALLLGLVCIQPPFLLRIWLLNRGCLKDALNRGSQHGIEFSIRLLGRQSLEQRARKARDNALIVTQAIVRFILGITTGERKDPHDFRMCDELCVKVVLLWQRKLDENQLPGWQFAELLEYWRP